MTLSENEAHMQKVRNSIWGLPKTRDGCLKSNREWNHQRQRAPSLVLPLRQGGTQGGRLCRCFLWTQLGFRDPCECEDAGSGVSRRGCAIYQIVIT